MVYCVNPNCQQRLNRADCDFCQVCGHPLTLHDRYRATEPLRPLNKSLYVDIFEVKDQHAPADFKVLKVLKSSDEKLVQLFQREAQVLSKLTHPNIPKLESDAYFTFPPSNQSQIHCLVMEKIAGRDLAAWLQDYRLNSATMALDWLSQLTNILYQLHSNDLFHRDIKPSNIILKPDGDLALIDFGAVRATTETVDRTDDITLVLTPGYAPPEQWQGQAVPQSDFYALGRTFVHLLTGRHPSSIEDSAGRFKFAWRNFLPAKFPVILADFIDELMAPLVDDRPSDLMAVRQRITDIEHAMRSPERLTLVNRSSANIRASINQQIWQQRQRIGLIVLRIFLVAAAIIPTVNNIVGRLEERKDGQHLQLLSFKNYPKLKWLTATFSNPYLPVNNSSWQYFVGVKHRVNDPQIALIKPVLVGQKVGGKVLFDDIVVTEYNHQNQLNRTFPLHKLDTGSLKDWVYWTRNNSGKIGLSSDGHDDRSSIYIAGATDDSLISSNFLFQPKLGYSYQISGWMKGEQVSKQAGCQLRLDFFAYEGKQELPLSADLVK
jgi:serine/threonine protein kinase